MTPGGLRWGALAIVAFTMMAAYYVNDVAAPLKTMLESTLDGTAVSSVCLRALTAF